MPIRRAVPATTTLESSCSTRPCTDKFVGRANEQHDGYIRDNCLFRKEIDIYDKMSAQVKYMNNVVLNYGLTTYSPYEGWKATFNGTKGMIEAWLDIPYIDELVVDQEKMHAVEMSQDGGEMEQDYPIILHELRKKHKRVNVSAIRSGHFGGDKILQTKLFEDPSMPDPLGRAAGLRDGVMSILTGIAARKSIESGSIINIADLTDMQPKILR